MKQLQYLINGVIKETYYFPNKALCQWKRKQLITSGTHLNGKFLIK